MAGRRRSYGFSFSWRRALGISAAKGRLSRRIGIPLTRSGRERKAGRALGPAVLIAFLVGLAIAPKFNSDNQIKESRTSDSSRRNEDFSSSAASSSVSGETSEHDTSLGQPAVAAPPASDLPSTPHPSFDCGKASKRTEKMICTDPEIAQWDWRMGQALNRRYMELGRSESRSLRDEQRRWVAAKEGRCASAAATSARDCLLQEIKTRTLALETALADGKALPRASHGIKDRQP